VYILGSEGLVVHEEEIDVAGVVDEESLVSGWGEVTGLLVGTETDLCLPSVMLISDCCPIPNARRLRTP